MAEWIKRKTDREIEKKREIDMESERLVELSWKRFDLLVLNLKIFLSDFKVMQVSKESKIVTNIFPYLTSLFP